MPPDLPTTCAGFGWTASNFAGLRSVRNLTQLNPLFQATHTAAKAGQRSRGCDSSRDRYNQTSPHQKSSSSLALERSSYPIKIFILFQCSSRSGWPCAILNERFPITRRKSGISTALPNRTSPRRSTLDRSGQIAPNRARNKKDHSLGRSENWFPQPCGIDRPS